MSGPEASPLADGVGHHSSSHRLPCVRLGDRGAGSKLSWGLSYSQPISEASARSKTRCELLDGRVGETTACCEDQKLLF